MSPIWDPDDPEWRALQAKAASATSMKVCLTCGTKFPVSRYARNKPSRCPEHRASNWDRRRSAPGDYTSAEYLANRTKLLADKPLCAWCHRAPATTADHVRAIAEGGTHAIENLKPACERCNRLRGASLGGKITKLNRQGRTT
jgi:5-methylcytosine-specific restriction endonuclease McrA